MFLRFFLTINFASTALPNRNKTSKRKLTMKEMKKNYCNEGEEDLFGV